VGKQSSQHAEYGNGVSIAKRPDKTKQLDDPHRQVAK
jgi:hypothetical protein